MRTVEYRTTHVPAFLTKLWKLVTDTNSDDLISWGVGGSSFIIYDEIRFAKELLPMYFKHNNMASFVRQLNMYGFRKLSCIDQGGLNSTRHDIEFYHHYFIKHQESLLELIKRKMPTSRSSDGSKLKPEYVKELLSNIKYLQGRQQHSEDGMKNLRKENKLLWRQLTLLNTRYVKQQAMLQQVLPMFVNMMQSSHRLPPVKRWPLMIHDGENKVKSDQTESCYSIENPDSELSSDCTPSSGNISNRGPVIHDVTEAETCRMYTDNTVCSSNVPKENEVFVDSPLSSLASSEHTMEGSFSESATLAAAAAAVMEPLNVVNCNFRPNNLGENMQPTGLLGQGMQLPPSNLSPNAQVQFVAETEVVKNSIMSILNEDANHGPINTPPVNSQFQAMGTALSWIPLNEQNLENWLGQVFTADNLMAGESLPAGN